MSYRQDDLCRGSVFTNKQLNRFRIQSIVPHCSVIIIKAQMIQLDTNNCDYCSVEISMCSSVNEYLKIIMSTFH